MPVQATKRRWKTIVCAAGLLLPLACMAVTHSDTTKASDPYDQWLNQATITLSQRPDADSLVTAAVLLQPSGNTTNRQPLQLLEKASRQDPSAADIAALAMLMCDESTGCDSQARARHLQVLAPDNALAWMPVLHAARIQNDAQQVTRILQRMAQAGSFKTYQPSLANRIHHGLEEVLPLPLANPSDPYQLNADNARILKTRVFVSSLPIPPYQDLMRACQINDAKFAARKSACRQIATELTQSWSMISNIIGVTLQRWTARDAQDYQQALARGREADWLISIRVKNCSQAHIVACLDADMKATSELDASRIIAHQLSKSVTPPDNWLDQQQEMRIRHDQERFHLGPGSAAHNVDGKTSNSASPAADRIKQPLS